MNTYIITVKGPRVLGHNPRNKRTGLVKIRNQNGHWCTDSTGEHHSVLIQAPSHFAAMEKAREKFDWVTRVEEATWLT